MTKALTYDDIQQRVQAHGLTLITTEQEWLQNRGEHITVRSSSGYEQIRRIDIFAPGAVQATCQYDRTTRKGETLAVLAAGAPLGTTLIREYTPSVLIRRAGPRSGAMAPLVSRKCRRSITYMPRSVPRLRYA
jgi:hypothetical protein